MAYHFIFQFQFGAVGEAEGIEITKTDQHLAKLIKLFPNGVLIRFNQEMGLSLFFEVNFSYVALLDFHLTFTLFT